MTPEIDPLVMTIRRRLILGRVIVAEVSRSYRDNGKKKKQKNNSNRDSFSQAWPVDVSIPQFPTVKHKAAGKKGSINFFFFLHIIVC